MSAGAVWGEHTLVKTRAERCKRTVLAAVEYARDRLQQCSAIATRGCWLDTNALDGERVRGSSHRRCAIQLKVLFTERAGTGRRGGSYYKYKYK
jgi:hypothetical protein